MSGTSSGPSATVRAAGIVLGAGSGTRVGASLNKVFLPLAGRRVLAWSLLAFARVPAIRRLLLVVRDGDQDLADEMIDREVAPAIGAARSVEVITGGSTRHESELFALRHLAADIAADRVDTVLIHDGARPIIGPVLVRRLLDEVAVTGAVYPGLEDDQICATGEDGHLVVEPTARYVRAQTPQVFSAAPLLQAYEQAFRDGFDTTDTVSCWNAYQPTLSSWIPGDVRNIKITYPDDLVDAERMLRATGFQVQ